MPVTPGCPQAIIALLMSQANTHRSAADIKVLRRCGAAALQLAEAGLKQPTSATSKVLPAETIKALDAHRAAEANAGKTRAISVEADAISRAAKTSRAASAAALGSQRSTRPDICDSITVPDTCIMLT
jgi:hypothetical protein